MFDLSQCSPLLLLKNGNLLLSRLCVVCLRRELHREEIIFLSDCTPRVPTSLFFLSSIPLFWVKYTWVDDHRSFAVTSKWREKYNLHSFLMTNQLSFFSKSILFYVLLINPAVLYFLSFIIFLVKNINLSFGLLLFCLIRNDNRWCCAAID